MAWTFWKMHGAGNDFILVDDRARRFPTADRAWICHLCARHTGIGSEGLILVQPSAQAHFRMRFFDPDGMEATMCGNGARCVARWAFDHQAAPAEMTIETGAGLLRAQILMTSVRLVMTPPVGWQLNRSLVIQNQTLQYHFVNSGVPHVVIEVPAVEAAPVASLGPAIRYHAAFAPAGTNVNFITITGPQSLRVRTYERGVESETPACGTGMTAAALIAGRLRRVTPPVSVTCAHGDVLEVDYRLTAEGAENVTLLGPTAYVFEGTVEYSKNCQPSVVSSQ